jgi:hydroxyacylglutathione hydrolase
MLKVKALIFNAFQVNTYIVSAENGDCIIVDPACSSATEVTRLTDFLEKENLKPFLVVNTHAHVDHILGNAAITEKLSLKLAAHPKSAYLYANAMNFAAALGFELDKIIYPEQELEEGDRLKVGDDELKILYTPGHADGSICLYSKENSFVITGDVIFYASIGRTDFPTGSYEVLEKSIREKLYTLPDETIIYPGHGPSTKVGFEKYNNGFITV